MNTPSNILIKNIIIVVLIGISIIIISMLFGLSTENKLMKCNENQFKERIKELQELKTIQDDTISSLKNQIIKFDKPIIIEKTIIIKAKNDEKIKTINYVNDSIDKRINIFTDYATN